MPLMALPKLLKHLFPPFTSAIITSPTKPETTTSAAARKTIAPRTRRPLTSVPASNYEGGSCHYRHYRGWDCETRCDFHRVGDAYNGRYYTARTKPPIASTRPGAATTGMRAGAAPVAAASTSTRPRGAATPSTSSEYVLRCYDAHSARSTRSQQQRPSPPPPRRPRARLATAPRASSAHTHLRAPRNSSRRHVPIGAPGFAAPAATSIPLPTRTRTACTHSKLPVNGWPWDVSPLAPSPIALPAVLPEQGDAYEEIEYMPPKLCIEEHSWAPWDFEMPDYTEVGRTLRARAERWGYECDDELPTEVDMEVPVGGAEWRCLFWRSWSWSRSPSQPPLRLRALPRRAHWYHWGAYRQQQPPPRRIR
ncbi:hypothetical protein K438DRAFT_212019 [Mycena galopus ATCC 62051]|nr:hypothetical protein K438DRAFT_212019 [Mycena galopus ATCC 62051]